MAGNKTAPGKPYAAKIVCRAGHLLAVPRRLLRAIHRLELPYIGKLRCLISPRPVDAPSRRSEARQRLARRQRELPAVVIRNGQQIAKALQIVLAQDHIHPAGGSPPRLPQNASAQRQPQRIALRHLLHEPPAGIDQNLRSLFLADGAEIELIAHWIIPAGTVSHRVFPPLSAENTKLPNALVTARAVNRNKS